MDEKNKIDEIRGPIEDAQLEAAGYRYHHCASRSGYCLKCLIGTCQKYSGKFGEGFIRREGCYIHPNGGRPSHRYEAISYWIKK